MNRETFCRIWDRITLSPEADTRIQQHLLAQDTKDEPIKTGRKLSRLMLAAALSILILAITAGAYAVTRLELTVDEEHTVFSDQYNIFISVWEGEDGPLEFWYPKNLPEDFKPVYVSDPREENQNILFKNEKGDHLEFTWCKSSVHVLGSTRGSSHTATDIRVSDLEGYRFDHNHPEELGLTACVLLCWTAPDQDTAFRLEYLGVSEDMPDLLPIAESVTTQAEPLVPSLYTALGALGDWRITLLPENYAYDRACCYYKEELLAQDYPYMIHQIFLDKSCTDGVISLQYHSLPTDKTAVSSLEDITAYFKDDRIEVSVNGSLGYYVNSHKAVSNSLYWADVKSGLIFTLYAENLSSEQAVMLAESISAY